MNEPKEITRYKWEYSNFLEYVKKGKVQRAVIYAKALQIDRKTLVHWLNQPELREAMQDSIDGLVDGMQRAGHNDWRMYRELLKILGVDDETKVDVTSGGEPFNIIVSKPYAKPTFRTDTEANDPRLDELARDSS